MEWLYNQIWGTGVRLLHFGKRLGFSGPFERVLEKLAHRLIPPPKAPIEVTLQNGMKLILPPGFPRARTYATGTYEPEVTALLERMARPAMTAVDAGAFCGYYTLLLSALVGPSGRVYAFEAHPDNYANMMRNVRANGCENIVAVNAAVSNQTGLASLTLHDDADHHWLAPAPVRGNILEIQTISLDGYFCSAGWPLVDLVRLDIEGSECSTLEGMRGLSERNSGLRVILELDSRNLRRAGASLDSLQEVLRELGFRTGYVIEQDLLRFSLATGLPRSQATYNVLLEKQ